MIEQTLTPYQVIVCNLTREESGQEYGSVNITQLAAHLDQLYDQINELRWRVTELERQQQRLLNQHGSYND